MITDGPRYFLPRMLRKGALTFGREETMTKLAWAKAQPVYEAAERWIDAGLRSDDSLFTPGDMCGAWTSSKICTSGLLNIRRVDHSVGRVLGTCAFSSPWNVVQIFPPFEGRNARMSGTHRITRTRVPRLADLGQYALGIPRPALGLQWGPLENPHVL